MYSSDNYFTQFKNGVIPQRGPEPTLQQALDITLKYMAYNTNIMKAIGKISNKETFVKSNLGLIIQDLKHGKYRDDQAKQIQKLANRLLAVFM